MTIFLLSVDVGIGSEAVKYMWTMNALTEALLIAGGALGPEF